MNTRWIDNQDTEKHTEKQITRNPAEDTKHILKYSYTLSTASLRTTVTETHVIIQQHTATL